VTQAGLFAPALGLPPESPQQSHSA
jgi:predicted cobalt transporter CbtA